LGVALALAPIEAWLAVKGTAIQPLEITQMSILALAVIFWLIGFDIIYALQDYEFDRSHGLHSLVVASGPENALKAAFLAHMLMSGLLLLFGFLCQFHAVFVLGWLFILGCLMMEHWIARHRGLNWVYLGFFWMNAMVSAVFLAVVAVEVVLNGGFGFSGQ
jgi:4-hydroxybenzoate polyprenyltransferase